MKKSLLAILLLAPVLFSCNKVLEKDSVRVVAEQNMWNTLEDARAGVMGIYALTRAALSDNNGHWIYGDVRSGQFYSPQRQDLKAVIDNHLNAAYPVVEALSDWTRFYAIVNAACLFIERVGNVKANDKRYSTSNMTVDLAQARLLRAFAYFYMVRIWGDVPFIITSHDGQFENKPREEQAKILSWVEMELLAAAQDLPYSYSNGDIQQPGNYYNEDASRWNGALATKVSAYAILSHVAAWMGNYSNVAKYSKFVEDNYSRSHCNFQSTPDLTNSNGFFYNKNSSQMLGFNSDYGHIDGSSTGHLEELTLAQPLINKAVPDIYLPKDTIVRLFDQPNDERFNLDTVGTPGSDRYFTNFNGKYPIFSKIKVMEGGIIDPNFRYFTSALIFTRLEDIVLLRAEALDVLGDTISARNELTIVMTKRGITAINQTNKELIDLIFEERNRELLGEGQRWYDLVRYNRIKQNNPAFTELINSEGIYWPISRKLIGQNHLLTQNPYWQ